MDELDIEFIDEPELPLRAPPFRKNQVTTWGHPEKGEVRVILHQGVLRKIEEHAKKTPNVEIGGLLAGEAYLHEGVTYTEVIGYVTNQDSSPGAQSSRTHFHFNGDIWAALNFQKDLQYDELLTVGWFHSHPNHGIFLSQGQDTDVHEKAFYLPWQIAVVYDPVRHQGGIFTWQDGRIKPAPGFYELHESGQSEPIITWRNMPEPAATAIATTQAIRVGETVAATEGTPTPPETQSPASGRNRRQIPWNYILWGLLLFAISAAGIVGTYLLTSTNLQQMESEITATLEASTFNTSAADASVAGRLASVEAQITNLHQTIEGAQGRIDNVASTIPALASTQQFNDLSTSQGNLSAKVDTIRTEITTLAGQIPADQQEKLQQIDEQLIALQDQLNAQEERLQLLEQQFNELIPTAVPTTSP